MNVIVTAIPDVLIFEPVVFGDERGYFLETFRSDLIEKHIGRVDFVQDNESKSGYGVLRGLHFQKPPFTQSKLVRVVKGRVLDVAVDLRRGSPWYGKRHACSMTNGGACCGYLKDLLTGLSFFPMKLFLCISVMPIMRPSMMGESAGMTRRLV